MKGHKVIVTLLGTIDDNTIKGRLDKIIHIIEVSDKYKLRGTDEFYNPNIAGATTAFYLFAPDKASAEKAAKEMIRPNILAGAFHTVLDYETDTISLPEFTKKIANEYKKKEVEDKRKKRLYGY